MCLLYYCLLLPQNYIAEEILLGSIIINPYLLNFVTQNLDTEYFFIETHKIIYRNIITIKQNNKSHISPVNLAYDLKRNKILNRIGGIQLVTELIKKGQIFNSSNNIHFYTKQIIEIIQNNYNRRLIIQYGYNIVKLAYNHKFSNYTLYIKASQYLNYIYSKTNSKNLDNLQEVIGSLISNIQNKNQNFKNNKHLYSGFKDLDILTNGLPNGDLIVVAGRPSMGKTSFVMNITYHLIQYYHTQICVFSLEMNKRQILHKLISIGSNIAVQKIIRKSFNDQQWEIIQKVCSELLLAKIYINDDSNISIDEIKYLARIIIEKDVGNQTIIIDYLQLINENKLHFDNRNQELSHITRELKILAQNLKIPIIILSQLNRSIDKRINKTPLLSDLKESGCINYQLCLDYKYSSKVHIKTVIINSAKFTFPYFSAQRNLCKGYYKTASNYIDKIYALYQYTFSCSIHNCVKTIITDNHDHLSNYNWVKQRFAHEHETIFQAYKDFKNIEKVYIHKLSFDEYNMAFDAGKQKYTNLLCNQMILHNSIEQDADIVMMLYQNSINTVNENTIEHKALDIIISKNRNGPVGALRLNFYPETTIFRSIPNSDNFHLN